MNYNPGHVISGLYNVGYDLDIRSLDPFVVDALRGSLNETGVRGTLTEYLASNEIMPLVKAAIIRLEALTVILGTVKLQYSNDLWLSNDVRIGIGTYGWKYNTDIIKQAISHGVNFIDTAESYGYGRVETELGEILQTCGNVILATKVARNHMSWQSVTNAANRSAGKLRHVIDLYQVHKPNPKYPISETMSAMGKLVNDGLVSDIGVSNFSIDQIITAQAMLPSDVKIRTVQIRYNLLDRGVERALLPWCAKHNIRVIAYSPLGQKFGKLDTHMLRDVARRYDASSAQVALSWLMYDGTIPIPRTNNVNHAVEIAESTQLNLSENDIDELNSHYMLLE